MGGIIRGDVVDSTDVYAPKPSAEQDQQKAEEERRRREEEAKKANGG